MTKNEYLEVLGRELGALRSSEVNDIKNEIAEHFDNGTMNGKTEEEIAIQLGSPIELAKQYLDGAPNKLPVIQKQPEQSGNSAQSSSKDSSNSSGIVFVIFFNLFIGIWLWLTILGIVLGIAGIEIGMACAFFGIVISIGVMGPFATAGVLAAITLGLLCISGFAVTYFAIKYFCVLTEWYVNLNTRIWKEGL